MKKQYFLFSLLALLMLSSCSGGLSIFKKADPSIFEDDEDVSGRASTSEFFLYEVSATDTVSSLARKFKCSPDQIISLNNLESPYLLKTGKLLKIPRFKRDDEMDAFPKQEVKREVVIRPKKAVKQDA